MPALPEQQARQTIDAMLAVAGWAVQDYKAFEPVGTRGSTQDLEPRSCLQRNKFSPPLAEQTRIVAEVERRLSVVEELEAVVTTNLQRATCLRQSILEKTFTGEIV